MISILAGKRKPRVAYLGPKDTFSHEAVERLFGNAVVYLPQKKFDHALERVDKNEADLAIIPFFNPHEEHVRECQLKLFESGLIATRVAKVNVELHLASRKGGIGGVKDIASNRHVLKQCSVWLDKTLPDIPFVESESTAEAARQVAKGRISSAICSYKAAAKNHLKILAEHIENHKNFTLFFVLQRRESITEWHKYSFFCFKLQRLGQKMEILDLLERHRLRSSQQWTCPHVSDGYSLFFLEFFGRYTDLDVVGFEAEARTRFPGCKIVGTLERSMVKSVEQI